MRGDQDVRERPPGLIQRALAVLHGFLLLAAAPAPASTFVSEPQIVPPALTFCFMGPWTVLVNRNSLKYKDSPNKEALNKDKAAKVKTFISCYRSPGPQKGF